jgi:CheY-like chemotaxis protein
MLSLAGPDRDRGSKRTLETSRALSSSGKPLEILIVEDEALTALDFALLIHEAGGRSIAIVSSALEAEAVARDTAPDAILMDVRLAGPRDGIEAADAIRQFSSVPVVFVTANSDRATVERIRRFNGREPITKPVDMAGLIQAILDAVNSRIT